MVTIRDVARRAGVSAMTVSRVLNGSASVKAETRQRVESAIQELGYVPNAAARSLTSRRSDTVGMIVSPMAHPYWSQVAATAQRYLLSKGIGSLIGDAGDTGEAEQAQLDMMLRQGVDGLILFPLLLDPTIVTAISRRGLPVAVVSAPGDYEVDSVQVDIRSAARDLIRLLLARGHRRIGMVAAMPQRPLMYARYQGYLDALSEAGIGDKSLARWLPPIGDWRELAAEHARELLSPPHAVTAIFASAPDMGVGVIDAFNAQRLRIPDDVSLVVFNEIPALFSFLTIGLSPPAEDIGRLAAEMLYERLRGYEGGPRQRLLPATLRMGSSVGPPQKR